METLLRHFRVKGKLISKYNSESEPIENISNIDVELWHKAPMEVIFLGSAKTVEGGDYVMDIQVDSPSSIIVDGKIDNIFMKAYYNGVVVSDLVVESLIINEGYTDVGEYVLYIAAVEIPVKGSLTFTSTPFPPPSLNLLFQIKIDGNPLPPAFDLLFTSIGRTAEENVETTLHTNAQGYVQLDTPMFPVVKKLPEDGTVINYLVSGPLDSRSKECYIQLDIPSDDLYTLITDFVIYENCLTVFDGISTYYKVNIPEIGIPENIIAIHTTKTGKIYGYNEDTQEWDYISQLKFFMIEFPDELNVYADGFYTPSGTQGTITQGTLGENSTPFEDFKGTVTNPEPYFLNVDLEISSPETDPVSYSFTNLMPGVLNITHVEYTGDEIPVVDNSPTLEDIETVSGTTFSGDFLFFLAAKKIGTMDEIRKAGPIRYILGYNTSGAGTAETALLQSHVDLYSINQDATQNQVLIDEGYPGVFEIANTPKNKFIDDVVGDDIYLFEAAKMHEIAVQNQKLVSNLLAGTLNDLRLIEPTTPDVDGSSFVSKVLSGSVNACGCSDCKSNVSPFAYLMDLIKYAAAHVDYVASPEYEHGVDPVGDFVTLISDVFLQPFGTLNVSCSTLHNEFCRVRLVSEVLEQWVAIKITGGLISATRLAVLAEERKQYLLLVYRTILMQAGTSYEELRNVVTTNPLAEKIKVAQKLADKMGIPLYVPTTTLFTADIMWLTFNGGSVPTQELTAVNLETIFGFRDTQRDVVTNTPEGFLLEWKEQHLRDIWKAQDYTFTNYSREDVVAGSSGTFKSNWKPTIDPDIIGYADMTYLYDEDVPKSIFTRALWQRRKEDTDAFLLYCLNDSSNVRRTSADINNRIIKVQNRNIVTHVLENNEIQIKDPVTPFNWITFGVINRKLVQTDTDVILAKPLPAMFQPNGSTPKMRYKRVVNVSSISGTTSIDLDWPDAVIADQLIGGYAKLESTGVDPNSPYETSPSGSGDSLIASVTFNTDKSVTLVLGIGAALAPGFTTGTVKFTYEVEVPLYSAVIMDPEKITTELFTATQEYDLLTPAAFTSPFTYTVWEEVTGSWPAPIEPTYTDYGKLKQLHQLVISGAASDDLLAIVSDNLHMKKDAFVRMMQLMILCENYLASMFTAKLPTEQELYELASIFRNSGKTQLRATWVKEEIEYEGAGSQPYKLMLSAQYFWKSIAEPASGSWDPGLQTIPATVGDIDAFDVPIIDPELLLRENMLVNPEAKIYRDLYDARKEELQDVYDEYIARIPGNDIAFIEMLNMINTGDGDAAFSILPYLTIEALLVDLNSNDSFKVKEASDVLWDSFRMSKEVFNEYATIKTAFESTDPLQMPSDAEIIKAVKLFVSAYKRKQLYTAGVSTGWIDDEIEGSFPDGVPVKYYNVIKMNLAPGRSDVDDRRDWQRTLEAWNRKPWIQPDITLPENIKNISFSNWVYTTWTDRRPYLLEWATEISTVFNSTLDAGDLFTNLKELINLIVARLPFGYGTLSQFYVPYFIDIAEKEERNEDIRPYLSQLDISIIEYRYLKRVYDLLENENPTNPSTLLNSEYTDVIDILIAIRSRYVNFDQVTEEYDFGLILDQDYFKLFEPAPVSFPQTDLPVYNQWRSPYSERTAWIDILQTRIDREQAVKDKWKEVLGEAEDRNMPLMRDALIRALVNTCEAWQDAAERLAKSFLMETKDNCCVKHTRVSFAVETLQGLLFALQSGIYDDFIVNFKLIAPNFKREWEWIGSYNTWRSAMFVFIYPENLLYPTLKRKQSPKFAELAEKIANANRLSPEEACKVGDTFGSYLEDIENLEIVCTTTTYAEIATDTLDACCGGSNSQREYVGYYFGQSTVSKKAYYSIKRAGDPQLTHSMWEEIPLPENTKVIGCLSLCDRYPNDWATEHNLSLWLFYTFFDKGECKLAYLKKDLAVANSSWTEGEEIELPTYPYNNVDYNAKGVELCQHGNDWNRPAFLINYSYPVAVGGTISLYSAANYDKSSNELESLKYQNNNAYYVTTDKNNFLTSIKMILLATNGSGINQYNCFVMVYPGYIRIISPDMSWTVAQPTLYPPSGGSFMAAFQCKQEENVIVVIGKDASGIQFADRITITFANEVLYKSGVGLELNNFPDIEKIHPAHTQVLDTNYFTVKLKNYIIPSGCILTAPLGTPLEINGIGHFALIPQKVVSLGVDSAECIANMGIRQTSIQSKILANLNHPQGIALPYAPATDSIRELLYEAYYYFPMLLALDQQRRGQFESALSWYRSVYDYTNPLLTGRKIFYGLVLEQNITNSFAQATDWLLDPLNPHQVAKTRANAYTKYTLMNIIQCMFGYADREFTLDTIETVPIARKLYTTALELLQTTELGVKSNTCLAIAYDCLNTQTEMSANRSWVNMYSELKKAMAGMGSVSAIEGIETEVVALMNAGTEENYPVKFAEAFELIESSTPAPPDVQTVAEVLNGYKDRVNEAYQYVFALRSPLTYNSGVGSMYAEAVARISGLDVQVLNETESETQLEWLTQAIPDNNATMGFEFARPDGQQQLPADEDLQFNPLQPLPNPFTANLNYFNAAVLIYEYTYQVGMPAVYTPLMDYVFCMPQNPVYEVLQLKGNLELYKIWNCRNIAGMVRELSVYSAETDAVTGVPVIGANGNLLTPGIGNFTPSQYRFKVLIERAKQIAAQAQQMESLFLAALEKEDAANYDLLRARQDLQTARATVKLQDLRITQARDERGVADLQLNKVTFMQSHYNDLIAGGLLDFERNSLDYLIASEIFQYLSAGLSVAQSFVDIRYRLGNLASASGAVAGALSTQASFLSQMASYQRREQEWEFQSQLAGFDISLANQQIKIAEDGVRIATQEREISVLNTTHAENTLEFLRTKFTNADLYNFMGNVLEGSYSYMLNLTTAIARTAESQLYFERQEQAGPFILDDYWETPSNGFSSGGTGTDRRGLTGSARLLVDLTRLDQYAFDTAKRKLQMTKVISIAQNFPSEFQQFKETGVLYFELTNKLFDYDFPGHYLRLINSVKTTVVGLLPVYDQIKATLTADTTSYTVIGGTTFQKIPIRRAELDSVALSAANNATGLFELQPAQSEFLNPFEGMGIESRWEFKMPKFSNRIDYSNIADVLITVEYTALDSYQYRYQVLQDLDNNISFNRGFSFKNNFPDQWYELAEAETGTNEFGVTIQLKREFFPQGIQNLQLSSTEGIVLYFVREDGYETEIVVFDFSKAVVPASTNYTERTTVDGKLSTNAGDFGTNPLITFRLLFENTIANRELFSEEKIKDILLLVPCKAELNAYPL